jgi:hypothetical protein
MYSPLDDAFGSVLEPGVCPRTPCIVPTGPSNSVPAWPLATRQNLIPTLAPATGPYGAPLYTIPELRAGVNFAYPPCNAFAVAQAAAWSPAPPMPQVVQHLTMAPGAAYMAAVYQ